MNLVTFGAKAIDVDKLVGIENGEWSDQAQDWKAVAVMHGDTRISLGLYRAEFEQQLLALPPQPGTQPLRMPQGSARG